MSKYIDGDTVFFELTDRYKTAKGEARKVWREALDIVTAVEDIEVKRGRNLDAEYSSLFECSVCHWSCWDTLCGDTPTYNYCPNCGARMDEECENESH